jgi:putative transposase
VIIILLWPHLIPLIESESYLLEVYRYIELNPVRANMVEEPSAYNWSSYQCNALGKSSTLRKPHELYLRLGDLEQDRLNNYREPFKVHVSESLITELRKATNSGLAIGGENFVMQIEELTGQRVSAKKRGRPCELK